MSCRSDGTQLSSTTQAQHSVWIDGEPAPVGWRDGGFVGTKVMDASQLEIATMARPTCDTNATVHEAFARQVAGSPDSIALACGTATLTYRELNERANRLARRLLAHSLAPEALVIIALDRSVDMVVALLATLQAGGAYVPLDLSAPAERLAFMVADTGAGIVITDRIHAERCAPWALTVVLVDDDRAGANDAPAGATAQASADSLAYVMYTSGSTGRPKGVAVTHRGVIRLAFGLHQVHLDASERVLQMAPASFDASTFEIWGALLNGGRCAIFPPGLPSAADLGRYLREQAITTLWLTSSLFNAIVDENPSVLAPVRQLLVGGDALSVAHIRRAQGALPQTTIINGYGPTEATTFTCCHRLAGPLANDCRLVPIGHPLSNTEVYLLDEEMEPVPAGAPGELYVGGDGLARGYLNQPALTAERFVPNPFGVPGSRLYRTGDWARHLPDGSLEFLGRRDGQIKLRGFRVEIGEIEAAIRQQPAVRDAAVVVHEHDGDKRLAAYLVVDPDAPFSSDALRERLRASLPDYMVPSWLLKVAALPLTANGKLDRKALPPPDTLATEREPDEIARPENVIEAAITVIWRQVLGLTTAGIHDTFFDAGGHSLLATKLVGRIRSDLGVAVPLRTVFEQPTIAGLAQAVADQSSKDMRARRSASPWTYLFDLSPGRGTEPVFFLPGGTGGDYEFLVYARLVHHVADRFKFFGLRAISADGTRVSQASVEAMAADYIGEMLKVHPSGPFRLVGNCIGGVVAFEVAQQLRRQGHCVSTLVLMDTDYPSQRRYARYRWRRLGGYITGRMEILGYYRRRLSHHRSELKARRWLERFRYVAGRTKTVVRDSVELQDGLDLAETYKQSYQQTLRRYRPVPYDGAAKFIVSEKRHRHDPIGAWAQTVRGPITILQAPGDHEAYIRDHVRVVAEQLRLCLQEESEQRL